MTFPWMTEEPISEAPPVFTAGVSCPFPHRWIAGAFVLGFALAWMLRK
jgi:hypothetical protein